MSYYDENARQYYENTINFDPEELCRMFTAGVRRYLNEDKSAVRLLDLGCGSARDSFHLSGEGFEVTGIDLSFKLLSHSVSSDGARRLRPPSFLCADFLKLPFKAGSFDAVFAQASLLHIPKKNIAAVIKEVNRVMRHGGLLYFSVKEGSGESFDEKGRFFAYYDREEIAGEFSGNGFEIVDFQRKASRDGLNNEAVWLMYLALKPKPGPV